MPNRFVIFPEGKLAEAEAYKAYGDQWFQAMSGETNGVLGLVNTDAFGQHVTVYAGPPFTWDGVNIPPEEPEGLALRADGVLHDDWVRPPDE